MVNAQQEKRLAPQPPGRHQPERRRHGEEDLSTHLSQTNKRSKENDVRTVGVPPQRSVPTIAPLSRPPKDVNSETLNSCAKVPTTKRPAPSRPLSNEELSSTGKTSVRAVSKTKPIKTGKTLNPFDDDDDVTTSASTGPFPWPPAEPHTVDRDAASQAKVKSSKMARAPAPPAPNDSPSSPLIHQDDGGPLRHGPGLTTPIEARDPDPQGKSHMQVQESLDNTTQSTKVLSTMVAGVKEEGPPVNSRR